MNTIRKVLVLGLFIVTTLGSVAAGVSSIAPGGTLQANMAQGAAFEAKVVQQASQTQTGVVEQVTVRTRSGVRTRLDIVGRDVESGAVWITEAKSSTTAPLTTNQRLAFPEIEETGATVVGKGKPSFPGGTYITPTPVVIVRPGG
jgi:filamentous hemagglutinin